MAYNLETIKQVLSMYKKNEDKVKYLLREIEFLMLMNDAYKKQMKEEKIDIPDISKIKC